MPNSLYEKFGINQNGKSSNFGDQNVNQQFNSFVQQLDEDIKRNPQNTVQKLINSGQMSMSQFEQFRQMANFLTGKNY